MGPIKARNHRADMSPESALSSTIVIESYGGQFNQVRQRIVKCKINTSK